MIGQSHQTGGVTQRRIVLDGAPAQPARQLSRERIDVLNTETEMHGAARLTSQVLSSGRYFLLLAILGSFFAACGVLIFAVAAGVAEAIDDVRHPGLDPGGVKHISVEVISLVDLFLLGTVLYVVAVGLHQLFIDSRLPAPGWLHISDLDELKERLIGTVIVLLAVSFLGYVVTWDGTFDVLGIGAAIGVVVVALALVLFGRSLGGHGHRE